MRERFAIAHDYLTQRGGAERVVLAMAKGFPGVPIYTTLYEPASTFPEFRDLDIRTSPLNSVGFFRRDHRRALPLLPWAASRIRIDAEVVIASSSGWAHGFGGQHRKLVYCYSPARWLYQREVYLAQDASRTVRAGLATLAPALSRWDKRNAARAHRYLAISSVVRQRIQDTYGQAATILPAPVNTHLRDVTPEPIADRRVIEGDYLLCVSRLLPYKNVDKVVSAFRALPEERLVVVGDGPERENLTRSSPSNVSFLTHLSDGQMRTVYEQSAALVAASFEDFGLTPLEAALFGKPSVVLRGGGYLDTMIENETAIFFSTPDSAAIAAGVREFRQRPWSAQLLKEHAERFNEDAFVARLRELAVELALRH